MTTQAVSSMHRTVCNLIANRDSEQERQQVSTAAKAVGSISASLFVVNGLFTVLRFLQFFSLGVCVALISHDLARMSYNIVNLLNLPEADRKTLAQVDSVSKLTSSVFENTISSRFLKPIANKVLSA